MVGLITGRISVPPKSALIRSQCFGLLRRLVGVWAEFVPEERVVGTEGTDVEVEVRRRYLRGAAREDMLPERSTMTTTLGFKLSGRLNLWTKVTMRAFELGSLAECGERMVWVEGVVCGVSTETGWDGD